MPHNGFTHESQHNESKEWYTPNGSDTPKWMKKFCDWDDGIALVFSRTDTNWFHNCATKCDALLFLNRRIKFISASGNKSGSSGCGSLLVANGDKCVEALKHSNLGFFVDLRSWKWVKNQTMVLVK